MSDPGCAVNADGTLKPASQISFYHDVDSDAPMTGPSASARPLALSNSASSISQGRLDGFVHINGSGKAPASFVAGARRSGRVFKPSAKIRDATSSLSTIPAKRPAPVSSNTVTRRRSYTSIDTDVDTSPYGDEVEDDEMPELEEVDSDDEEDEEDEETRLAAEEFIRNQAFADTDRDVSYICAAEYLYYCRFELTCTVRQGRT
jgi:hypothetical protein